jgi:predicted N-acetyltransferase YhbS
MKPGKRQLGPCTLKLTYSQVAPANLRGGLFEVSGLHTAEEHQKKGYATRLLDEVCEEADEAKKVLVIMPDEPWQMPYYGRFGFEPIQAEPVIMARAPKPVASH